MFLMDSLVPSEITDSLAERFVTCWSKFETSNLSVRETLGTNEGSICFASNFGMSNYENQG